MRVQVAIPEPHVTKPVLDSALEAVTKLNEQMITSGEVPSFERGLRYGVQWRPEPPGDEHFDSAEKVLKRGWGDCDDLAPWHAASLRASGEDPNATAVVRKSGPKRWHAIVQRGDGSVDDPSLRAGMAAGVAAGVFGVAGAAVPLMMPFQRSAVVGAYIVRPHIAVRPIYGQHQARADLPWLWGEHMTKDRPNEQQIAMTALHTAPVAQTALVGAIEHVVRLAHANGNGHDDHIDRLCAIADACEGSSYGELAEVYGQEHAEAAAAVVGSLFGKIARGLGKVARKSVSFIPGVGPAASLALDAGSGLAHHGHPKHKGPGAARQQARPASPPASHPAQAARAAAAAAQPGLAAVDTGTSPRLIIHNHFH